jgi:hypothetical protein
MFMTQTIDGFLTEWTNAERSGDTSNLELLLAHDFLGVGPLGFVLLRVPGWPALPAASPTTASSWRRSSHASTATRQ